MINLFRNWKKALVLGMLLAVCISVVSIVVTKASGESGDGGGMLSSGIWSEGHPYFKINLSSTKLSTDLNVPTYRTNFVNLEITDNNGITRTAKLDYQKLYDIGWHNDTFEVGSTYMNQTNNVAIYIPIYEADVDKAVTNSTYPSADTGNTTDWNHGYSLEGLLGAGGKTFLEDSNGFNLKAKSTITVYHRLPTFPEDLSPWLDTNGNPIVYDDSNHATDRNNGGVFSTTTTNQINDRIDGTYNLNFSAGDIQTQIADGQLVIKAPSSVQRGSDVNVIVELQNLEPGTTSSNTFPKSYTISNLTSNRTITESTTLTNGSDSKNISASHTITVYDEPPVGGTLGFNPDSSYGVSGNRSGWVNKSIPVTVTAATSTATTRESKSDYSNRSYKYDYTYRWVTNYSDLECDTSTSPAHTHDDSCYEQVENHPDIQWIIGKYKDVLTCTKSTASHSHTDSCYGEKKEYYYAKTGSTSWMHSQVWKVGGVASLSGGSNNASLSFSDGSMRFTIPAQNGAGITLAATAGWNASSSNWAAGSPPESDGVWHSTSAPSISAPPVASENYSGGAGVYKIDVTSPAIQNLKFNAMPQQAYWYRGPLNMTATVYDALSGVYGGGRLGLQNTLTGSTSSSNAIQASSEGQSTSNQLSINLTNPTGKFSVTSGSVEDYASNNLSAGNTSYWVDNTYPVASIGGANADKTGSWISASLDNLTFTFTDAHSKLASATVDYTQRTYEDGSGNIVIDDSPMADVTRNFAVNPGNNESNTSVTNVNFAFSLEGIWNVAARAVDAVGNAYSSGEISYKIDLTPPQVRNFVLFTNGVQSAFNDPNAFLLNNTNQTEDEMEEVITDNEIEVRFEAKDNLSGIAGAKYWWTNGTINTPAADVVFVGTNNPLQTAELDNGWKSVAAKFTLPADDYETLKYGEWTLQIMLVDRAGNLIETDRNKKPAGPITNAVPGDIPPGFTNGETGTPGAVATIDSITIRSHKVLDFRSSYIYDPRWESIFGDDPNSPLTEVYAEDMSVLKNDGSFSFANGTNMLDISGNIGLGYAVDFEIDAIGYEGAADEVTATARYFAETNTGTIEEVDIYIGNGNEYVIYTDARNAGFRVKNSNIALTQSDRMPYEGNLTLAVSAMPYAATYKFSTMVPYDVKMLPLGSGGVTFDAYANRQTMETKGYKKLLVTFDIDTNKAGVAPALQVNYTEDEDKWNNEVGVNSIVNNWKDLDLIGRGNHKGQIFWYDMEITLEDIQLNGGISK